MTDLQLLKIAIQKLKISGIGNQKEIGKLLGYSNESSFSQVLNGKVNIPADLFDRISNLNNDIKIFINENKNYKEINYSNAKIAVSNPERIELPLISISARASFDYDTFPDAEIYETVTVYKTRVKNLKNPVLIDVDGDSMEPQLKSGTRILADQIDESNWVYSIGVVGVAFGNQFVVKRIKENKAIETGVVTLYSDNPLGGEFNVRLSDIKAMWKAVEIVKSKIE